MSREISITYIIGGARATTGNPNDAAVFNARVANSIAYMARVASGEATFSLTGAEAVVKSVRRVDVANPDLEPDKDADGYRENQGDCNDTVAAINPGATEICGDGIDQDCNGSDLPCPIDPTTVDDDGDGYTENQGDCNDASGSIHPGAVEICGNGVDEDCSGADLACSGTCIDQPDMAEIAGVWDFSYDAGVLGHDVIYVQINADGSYLVFDYAGDTFDNEANCYWTDQGQLTSLGNGVFVDSYDGTSAAFTVCGDQLTISDDSGSETYNRATVTDFTPICN